MERYQYQSQPFLNEQDRARLNLLRCSDLLEHPAGKGWGESVRQTRYKSKQKRFYTEMLQQKDREEGKGRRVKAEETASSGKLGKEMGVKKQGSVRPARRYSTDYLIEHKIHHSPSGALPTHALLSPTKNNIIEGAFQPAPPPFARTKSKTVFIHMFKNKSANLQPNGSIGDRTIHSLSAIKVRIMTRKIEQSKHMNCTQQQLKSKLDKITGKQPIPLKKQKTYFKHSNISLYHLLSKRQQLQALPSPSPSRRPRP